MKNIWDINRTMQQEMKFGPHYDYIDQVTHSGPTCEDFGIPPDDACALNSTMEGMCESFIKSEVGFAILHKQEKDPFSPSCLIPLPSPFGVSIFDSTCFRRRNERERDRVRCVNDGYLKLKQHLPIENKDKRLSKVETLRYAIKYIKYLEDMLNTNSEVKVSSKRETKFVLKAVSTPETFTHKRSKNDANLEFSGDDADLSTDTSDYESKYDTSSEADVSE